MSVIASHWSRFDFFAFAFFLGFALGRYFHDFVVIATPSAVVVA
jgi:hypothetical protein